jgi:hypothetical protein
MGVQPLQELEAAFPDEWVLLDEVEEDPESGQISGRLVVHSHDRDAIDAAIDRLPVPRNFGVFFVWGRDSRSDAPAFML